MKKNKEVEVAAPIAKADAQFHEDCGGMIFRSSHGRKCLKCSALLGGQDNGKDMTPRRQVNPGTLVGVLTSRASVSVSNGRLAKLAGPDTRRNSLRKILALILFTAALLIPYRASAALSVIQATGASTPPGSCCGASASLATAFGSNVTAGSSIFVGCLVANNSTTVGVPTDTRSNSYSQAVTTGVAPSGNWGTGIAVGWTATGSTAGADTVTVTFSPSAYALCFILEIGTASSALVDKTAFAVTGSNTTSYDSGATATTTAANELIVGFGGTINQPGNFTAGSGFTLISVNGGNWQSGYIEYKSVSSTGTYNADATSDTQTSSGVAVVVTLKEAAAARTMPPVVF